MILPEVELHFEAAGAEPWSVLHLRATEALSETGAVTAVLASRDLAASPEALFGEAAALTVARGPRARRFRGVVRRVEDLGSTAHHRVAEVTLAPSLWLLSLRRDARIFQRLNAPAIVSEVLRDAGLYQGDGELVVPPGAQALPAREYCVQYRESDLDFVTRVLADEGLAFSLAHDGDREVLTLADEPARPAAVPTLDGGPVRVLDAGAATASTESVQVFDVARALVSTSVTLREYDFTHPRAVLDMTPRSAAPGAWPVYEHPGGFALGPYDDGAAAHGAHQGARTARVRHQELAQRDGAAAGRGDVTGFAPGRSFELRGHARPDLDGPWVVTSVEHEATAWGDVADDLAAHDRLRDRLPPRPAGDASARYVNAFACVRASVAWRPPRVTPRPVIAGPQTAVVMAPAGADEEVATDVHGRVLVRFPWERPELRTPSQRAHDSSCWVRVAQPWAGAGWGAMFIPRVGMEVVVTFLEGDPDRPLVTGCVYNGENRPPLTLPAEKTRSTVKTSSSRGGGGFNELRFEDLAGREQIFVHAQRDHDTVVRRDQTLAVGRDRVKTVDGSEHDTVRRDRVASVEGNDALDVGGNHTVAVHGGAGASVRVDAGYVLSAHDSIALTVGDTSLVLLPDRATLSSKAVHVLGGELVNVYGGLTRINCDDGDRDAPTARAPRAARSVGLQGEAGGSLHRTLAALEPASLVAFAAAAVDRPMADVAAPDRLRARLAGAVKGSLGEWFRGLAAGATSPWVKAAEAQVASLVGPAVQSVLSRVLPAGGLGGALGDRVLQGLAAQVKGALAESATSGLLHAMALDRGASADPFWHALQQRAGGGVQGALLSFAKETAGQQLTRYARRLGADGAGEALAGWLRPGADAVIDAVGPSLLPRPLSLT